MGGGVALVEIGVPRFDRQAAALKHGVARIDREVEESAFELGGVEIGAKSICILSPYVMQRDPRWFPEPERFDPERWTQEARDARPKFSYFPFGGGARVCIGERFAWMEGVLLLATVAQKWRFKLVPGHPVETAALITLRAKHGMKMVAEKRSPVESSPSSSTQSHPIPA